MEKKYCKVVFTFGTYTFFTFEQNLKHMDMTVCKVKGRIEVGTFLEYCNPPIFDTKPCYGSINSVLDGYDLKYRLWEIDQKIKETQKECTELKPGHRVLLNGLEFVMNEKGQFVCVGRA